MIHIPMPISRAKLFLHLAGLIVLLNMSYLLPNLQVPRGFNLAAHTITELLAVLFSMMIFVIGWFSYVKEQSRNIIAFSSLFLCVGLLDLGHMLSYEGMAVFPPSIDLRQSVMFWLAARFVAAVSFLCVAWVRWRTCIRYGDRYIALAAALLFTSVAYWLILGNAAWFPLTYIAGQGVTLFKVVLEYTIIGLYGISAVAALICQPGSNRYRNYLFFWAMAICMMGEITMSISHHVTDAPVIFSHVCKLVSYIMIFISILWDQIKIPYQMLKRSEREIRDIRDRLFTTLESIYNGIVITDEHGCVTYMNPTAVRFLQRTGEEAISRPVEEVFKMKREVHPVYSCIFSRRSSGVLAGEVDLTDRRQSRIVPVEYSIAPMIGESGDVTGTVLVFQDVSDRIEFQQSQERLISILEATSDFVAIASAAGETRYLNRASRDILGLDESAKIDIRLMYPAWAQAVLLEESIPMAKRCGTWNGEIALIGASGDEIPVHQVIVAHKNEANEVLYYSTIARNLSDMKMAEYKNNLAAKVFENITEGVMVTDSKQVIQFVNPAFSAITGYDEEEIIGQTPRLLSSGRHDADFYRHMWTVIKDKGSWKGEIWNKRKNGEIYLESITIKEVKDKGDSLTYYIALFKDITIEKELEARIQHQAYHDVVTDLPNRLLLNERIGQSFRRAARNHHSVGIMFLDLDRFKRINDTFGHSVGDLLLKDVARRLKNSLRSTDTIARVGGDEFVILIPDLRDIRESSVIAQKIILALTSPFFIERHELYITVSIGISHYPQDGDNGELLIRRADTAMYKAKELGKNNYQIYALEQEKQTVAPDMMSLEISLRRAVQNGELHIHYQPQYNSVKGELIGVEALVRWKHPEWGNIPPSQFIPLAEESGLIAVLDQWVLKQACERAKSWMNQGFAPVRVSVNLSMLQFRQPDLVHFVSRVLWETGLPPEYLELELTESMVMDNPDMTMHILNQLKAMGIRISLDDFGIGYSSLNYLKKLPIDRIKIDQSFVKDLSDDPGDQAIVQTIITLCHTLKLHVIAEGVETEDQLDYLKRHQCEEVQGFLYSRPLPEDEVVKLMRYGAAKRY
ncbi:EAL domain-containing protein [Paenibacillus thalictri]|uniref:EAL domain-containing protein n=1 Tax=Paenibacillus thalictri TaxID=2527873 RepID=A0A4Q9DPL1_9BACL|nr:EAL domain-containing protein [Paenibacillus thalictri]TBL76578.1 EAL domain-containing protein [Paenibacillus thalictri]